MSYGESVLTGGRNSSVRSELEFTDLTNLDLFPGLDLPAMNPKEKSAETNIPIIPSELNDSSDTSMSDFGSTKSSECREKEIIRAGCISNNKIMKIKLNLSEEEELLNYLSNDNKTPLKNPFVNIVRLPNDVGLSSSRADLPGVHIVKTIAPKRTLEHNDDEFHPSTKSYKCMSKNAILAREARQKKKEQLTELENANKKLLKENQCMKKSMNEMEKASKALHDEICYLRSVIANQSTLSSLLRNINTPDIILTSSECLSDIQPNVLAKPPSSSMAKNKDMKNSEQDSSECLADIESNISSKRPLLSMGRKESNESKKKTKIDLFSTNNMVTTSKRIGHSLKVAETDHAYQKPGQSNLSDSKKPVGSFSFSGPGHANPQDAGVCLHVSNGAVSLEFCGQCSTKAGKAFEKLVPRK
ncbi:unnamed protein product [Owenia fusiformis]|uniref:Uncharacterized protein n=1 Tax=Owenia fusiformis TaxID=6347 RepID=A0A8J1U3E3_OWEFU|nr:unnamed protein product [Owenia fusiformis]